MHRREISARSHPDAERSYLSDGSGLAWSVPAPVRDQGRFAVDAEIVRPVRSALVRRYGVTEPVEFARRWTRAEALAKVHDVPIVVWLGRHGLGEPSNNAMPVVDEFAWCTVVLGGIVMTFSVLRRPGAGRAPGVVGGAV